VGLDVVPDFIAKAGARGGKFKLLSYQEFAAGKWLPKVDCVMRNISLIGKELVGDVREIYF
jgi:hypothetical protein